jgi:amino acid transporter
VNAAFLYTLGFEGLQQSKAVGADAVAGAFPGAGAALVSALVCVSALGAVNGLIFTGARITYALGADHRLFGKLGRWHPKLQTPAAALALQGGIALALIVLLGSFVEAVLYTAATVYSFYLATTLAVFVLRRRDPGTLRPYKVWGYPVTPIVFAATCGFLIQSAVTYKPLVALAAIGLLLLGVPVYWLSRRLDRA